MNAKSKKIIQSIKLVIDGKKIDLSVEEAQELRDALLALMPVAPNNQYVPVIYKDRPWWWFESPWSATTNYGSQDKNTFTTTAGTVSVTPEFT